MHLNISYNRRLCIRNHLPSDTAIKDFEVAHQGDNSLHQDAQTWRVPHRCNYSSCQTPRLIGWWWCLESVRRLMITVSYTHVQIPWWRPVKCSDVSMLLLIFTNSKIKQMRMASLTLIFTRSVSALQLTEWRLVSTNPFKIFFRFYPTLKKEIHPFNPLKTVSKVGDCPRRSPWLLIHKSGCRDGVNSHRDFFGLFTLYINVM